MPKDLDNPRWAAPARPTRGEYLGTQRAGIQGDTDAAPRPLRAPLKSASELLPSAGNKLLAIAAAVQPDTGLIGDRMAFHKPPRDVEAHAIGTGRVDPRAWAAGARIGTGCGRPDHSPRRGVQDKASTRRVDCNDANR